MTNLSSHDNEYVRFMKEVEFLDEMGGFSMNIPDKVVGIYTMIRLY
jgi:hypothetical protein